MGGITPQEKIWRIETGMRENFKVSDGVSSNVIDEEKLHVDVTNLLTWLCFTPNYSGYNYVREAVKLAVAQEDKMPGISKGIYPVIAKQSGTTVAAVESGMRTAIRRAWHRSDPGSKLEIFGTYALNERWVPTNSEFVFVLADKLRCNAISD